MSKLVHMAARAQVSDAYEKAVLLILAEAADGLTCQTYIGQSTIAERCSISRRKVVSVMTSLEASGLIQRKRRSKENGHRSSDLITLRLDAPCADGQDARRALCEGGLSARHDIDKVHTVHSLSPSIITQIKDMSSEGPKPDQPESKKSSPKKDAYPVDFELAWNSYPHHPGRSSKPKSYDQWQKLSPDDRKALLAAIEVFAQSDQATKDNGQWVKAFDGWLKAEMWRDFMPTDSQPAKCAPIDWDARLETFMRDGSWLSSWGEKPGRDGCLVPAELLAALSTSFLSLKIVEGRAS